MDDHIVIDYRHYKQIAEKMGKRIDFTGFGENFTKAMGRLVWEVDTIRPALLDDNSEEFRTQEILRLGIKMGIAFAVDDIMSKIKM